MATAETPLMRQYHEVKSRYKDCLLFFRMGDFYELFSDDALVAAKALDITLTTRNKNDPNPIPMCGVPHHSAANYLNRLVDAGFKVAICEQLEDPSAAKGIVKRDVIRVVSPGTRLDPEALDAKAPNFTHAALVLGDGSVGWSTCDFTTGKFWFGTAASIDEWLAHARAQAPAELLFPDTPAGEKLLHLWRENVPQSFAQTVPSFYFDEAYAAGCVREQFGVATLSAVHPKLDGLEAAPGALIKYFQETQKAPRIPSAIKIELWGLDHAMELDAATTRALELFPQNRTSRDVSLLSFLDRTKTAMGGRLLRDWLARPLTSLDLITARQDQVESLIACFEKLTPALNEIYDLERLLSRVSLGTGSMATARELQALSVSVLKSAELATLLKGNPLHELLEPTLDRELVSLSRLTLGALVEKPPATTREGGMFVKGFNKELDELIELSENGNQWLADFEAREREATGISSLKVRFNRFFGYYIEITKANLGSAPKHYVRKQTMVGGERFITEELKTFEEKILTAEKKRSDMEHALFKDLCSKFAALSKQIIALARAVAHVDVAASLANVAGEDGYVRPVVDESGELEIIDGRHPTVAAMLAKSGQGASNFIPNTVRLSGHDRFLLITGPNMGGKSTVMRQTALITLLAQIGSFVPAKAARIGITDQIFTRIGASDNIAEGASTFMVEMSEMSFILRHATEQSLILIDEIGRGTSTYDGMSLAWALASDICSRVKARTLFATHYHELTQLASHFPCVKNARVAVAHSGSNIRFLYKLEAGVAERSYGILVARLAGLSDEVLDVAEQMLHQLESQSRKPKAAAASNQLAFKLEHPALRARTLKEPEASKVAEPSPFESWLKTLEIESLTPMQALTHLAQWKEKIKSDPPSSAKH